MSNWDTTLQLDRILGMFSAHFVGDALGAPFEFSWAKLSEFTGELDRAPQLRSRWQPTKIGVIGQTTDDTAMTLVLLDSLIENQAVFNRNKLIVAYNQWAKEAGMEGRNTRELLRFDVLEKNVLSCFERRWKKKFSDPEVAQNQLSNGCLMRSTPFALLKEWEEAAHSDCFLTNPSDQAWEYQRLYILGLKALLKGESRITVLSQLENSTNDPEILSLFQGEVCNLREKKGWIKNAFYCFLLALKWEGTMSEFLNYIISQAGDTDTNAAIAAAALGAALGINRLLLDESFARSWSKVKNADVSDSSLDSRQEYQGRDLQEELEKIF